MRQLTETEADLDPFAQFGEWFIEAEEAGIPEFNAMALATSTPDGAPSARMVLLKSFDSRGFVFYTNYDSRKGGDLIANPRVALVLFWQEIHRQIRIEGAVERVSSQESDEYFQSRARDSQLSALASHQSAALQSREELETRVHTLTNVYQFAQIPRPDYWGGFRVRPHLFEFWQGRPSRLHDRLQYVRVAGQTWETSRLSP